ncbi:OmpA family protein [Geminocystis sp. NIES-3709]|uniref:OmpA family protein n=1 Tax=Geminocystis sp. NIES-3709 TaxID=1617448 RepID=UPI0008254084|nr:OmpA family protein [Geminocystis sp. NIES-3709]
MRTLRSRSRNTTENQELDVFPSFTDLMSNAFMIMSLLLLLALFQSLELNRRLQSATPIIIDEKSGNFKFKSGSAELNLYFKEYLNKQIIPQIEQIIQERDIDFIQVIGHTDGQVLGLTGNLDQNLEKTAQNQLKVNQLNAGSNADLALMRALAVVQELQLNQDLKNVKFRAYSAAQLYLPSGELAPLNRQADETRRRIEIRFIPPGKNN